MNCAISLISTHAYIDMNNSKSKIMVEFECLTYKFKTFEPLNRIKHDFIDFNNNKIETNNV